MTTHEHRPEFTGTHEEPETAVAGTRAASEPTVPADQSTASTETPPPTAGEREPSASSVAAPESSTAGGGAAPGDEAGVAVAKHASANRESSAEETLIADDDLAELRARWAAVQAAFVDDPKECVQKADGLVSDLVEQLTTGFAHARSRLEEQWARGEDASTEDLRVALMQYRAFFERLLAV